MKLNTDFCFTIETPVQGTRQSIWQHITNMANVNAELSPFAAMTYPADKAAIGTRDVPLNETIFTSVILLLGFIPVDLHYLQFEKLEPGYAFYEHSTSLMMQYWKHTRSIVEVNTGFAIKDELHYKPRLLLIGFLLAPLYAAVFKNRHKKLNTILNAL